MRILKNNRRKNRLIKDLREGWGKARQRCTTLEHRNINLEGKITSLEKFNHDLKTDRCYIKFSQQEELNDIKDKYYKLLAAIKINEG